MALLKNLHDPTKLRTSGQKLGSNWQHSSSVDQEPGLIGVATKLRSANNFLEGPWSITHLWWFMIG